MKYSFKYNLFLFEYLIIWFLIVINIDENEAKVLSKTKLCADIDCKEPIGLGKTNNNYLKIDEMSVSFKTDTEVKIYGKSEDGKHFDIEVKGKRGFAPKSFITETQTFLNTKKLISVDINEKRSETNLQNESSESVKRTEDSVRQTKNADKTNESTHIQSSSTEQPIVFSSLSEESSAKQTKTPTRESFTIIDGTTISDGDNIYEPSPTDSSTPPTATKTPTISVNLDNDTEVNAFNESNDSLVNNNTDSPLKELDTLSVSSDSSESLKTEEKVEDTEGKVENTDKIKNNSNEHKSDKQSDSLENSEKSDSQNIDNNSNKEMISESVDALNNTLNETKSTADTSDYNSSEESTDSLPDVDSNKSEEKQENEEPSDPSDNTPKIEEPSDQNSDKINLEENTKLNENVSEPIVLPNQSLSDSTNFDTNKSDSKADENSITDENNTVFNENNSNNENNINISGKSTENSSQSEEVSNDETLPKKEEKTESTDSDSEVEDNENEVNNYNMSDKETESQTNSPNVENIEENVNMTDKMNDIPIQYKTNEVNYESNSDSIDNQRLKEEEGINLNKIEDKETVPSIPEIQNIETIIESQDMFKWLGLEGMGVTNVISDVIPDDIELILKQFQISAQVVVFTFIIAFNWCLMKILLSVFNSSKKETELRNICCKAERQIYYFEAEKQKLQKEIDRERENAKIAEERMQSAEHKVIPLEKEFIKLKNERELLHQKVVNLESELESASEAGLEANRLLGDFLTSQKENVNLNSSVDALQQQITKQAEIVAKYESTALKKEKENRELKDKFEKMSTELERMKNLLKETEHNLHTFQTNNEELKASKSELNESLSQLEEEYSTLKNRSEDYFQKNEELLSEVNKLSEELDKFKEQTAIKDQKIESLNDILSKFTKSRKEVKYSNEDEESNEEIDQIDSQNCDQSLSDLFNIVEMEVQLKNITNDRNELISKLEDLSEQCRQLSDKINGLESDNQILKNEKESAVQDRIKAENKLEVLTDYYNKKELEFGKEMGVQHIQRRQKEEDANSLSNRLISFEEENVSLRSQLQSMKKEIEDTERKYKSQINQLEKQVHENWILARNAERKLDESKAEAAVLRQTLTMSVKSPVDGFSADTSYLDDSASSISDHFGGALPPPPPPPMPPPPPLFNPMMPPMHIPYEESESTALWNQNMNQNMNPMLMPGIPPGIPPHFPPISAFNPIQNDISMNPNLSFANSQPINYVPQMGQQWDSSSNRDTFSPTSHRSTSSPHSQYNMYSQTNSHYSNPMTSMSSPTNSMSAHFQNPMTSVTSPIVNSIPVSRAGNVLSEPIPSHWTQPQRPNGNISNLNYSHNQYNESDDSSRPTSRNQRNDNSLHTSIV